MVEDAVFSELASEKFPFKWENNGKFFVFGTIRFQTVEIGELFDALTAKFPIKRNWEILQRKWECNSWIWEGFPQNSGQIMGGQSAIAAHKTEGIS